MTILKATIQQTIVKMEEVVRQHELFRQVYVDASDWIRKSKLDMQQFGDSNGERDALEEKQRKCSELRETFPHGQMLIDKAIDLSQVLKYIF